MNKKVLLTLLCLWLGLMPLAAQSIKLTRELQQVPMASVLAMYKNEFGSFENHALDDPFAYAVIRMHLEGSGQAVTAAKERLTLYLGQQFRVEKRVTTYSNQILFLVRARHPMIHIDCGDGCDQVLLSNMQQLRSNCLYDCTVQFTPEGDQPTTDTVFVERGPKYHNLNLHVKPNNATVEIVVNKERRIWTLEDGQLPLQLLEGDYDYTISANKYYTKRGIIHVPTNQVDTTIQLRCTNGLLSIVSDSMNLQGLSAKLSRSDGDQIVSLPVESFFCLPGTYSISIRKPDFQTYKRELVIKENDHICLSPCLVHKGKIQSFESISAIDITDKNVLISGNFPERYVIGTGLIYGTTSDRTQGVEIILNAKGGFEKEISNLEPNTEYFVWAYAYNERDTVYSSVTSFRTLYYSSVKNGHRYVDLGLSVKWAKHNIGTKLPEGYGDYFSWGETVPKEIYDWNTYKLCEGSLDSQIRYCSARSYGTVDNKNLLEMSDDAATVNWGGGWRMPTDAEWLELREKCTWKVTTINGVKGYTITSKINGNSIFLPMSGYKGNEKLHSVGSEGNYWSSLLTTGRPYEAWYVNFKPGSVDKVSSSRYLGFTIRPVCP